jgi:hypothetical protein
LKPTQSHPATHKEEEVPLSRYSSTISHQSNRSPTREYEMLSQDLDNIVHRCGILSGIRMDVGSESMGPSITGLPLVCISTSFTIMC